jgi:hypothetical protein
VGKRAQKVGSGKSVEKSFVPLSAEPRDTKLTIASAGYGQVTAEFCYSLAMACKVLDVPIRLDYHAGCYVHYNRNVLLDNALKSDSTHLMFIDTDIAFPRDGIPQLLAHKKPIVGGAYNLRKKPEMDDRGPVAVTTVKPLEGAPREMDRSKPFECRGLPTGFMLIELDVLRNLPEKPDFMGGRDGTVEGTPRKWFDFGNYAGFVGEDIYFCDFLRKQGVPIWCDPTIKLGHVGPHIY